MDKLFSSHTSHTLLLILFTSLGLVLYHSLRFLFRKKINEKETAFIGVMSQNISLLYSILLAFLVIVSWQNFSSIQATTINEATQVGALWRDSLVFDPATKVTLATNIQQYLASVKDYEWPRMEAGKIVIENPAYDKLWEGFLSINPKTETQKIFLESAARHLDNISELRRTRIGASAASLPLAIWILLTFGAVCSIFITLLFESVALWLRYLILGFEFILIFLTFGLINAFDKPYISFLALDTAPYTHTAAIMVHSPQFVGKLKENN